MNPRGFAPLPIDPSSVTPIFQQIVHGFERRILSGELRSGDAIPSVRDFAVEHSVNPNTVARAYQLLQQRGLAEVERGLGLRIARIDGRRVQRRRAEILSEEVDRLLAVAQALQASPAELARLIRERSKESGVK